MGDQDDSVTEGRRVRPGAPRVDVVLGPQGGGVRGDTPPPSPFVFGGEDDEEEDELRDVEEEIDTVEEDLLLHGADELIVKALASGGDELRQYARQIEGDLRVVERESIGDYVQESENLANLHMQIRGCDEILGSMETSLGTFQRELGKVSREIQGLQERATGLSVRAANRTHVEAGLSSYIDGAAVSPQLIHAVTESEVNESYVEFLIELRRKCDFVETDAARAVLSTATMAPVLENLRVKATERIRVFLLTKIAALGRPKTNFQIIQQSVLLKLRNLAAFLLQHAPEVYEEVAGRYVETMGRIYLHHIKAHLRHFARCQLDLVTSSDTIVQAEDTTAPASPAVSVAALFSSAAPSPSSFTLAGMSSMLGLSPGSPAVPSAGARSRDSALTVGGRAAILEGDGEEVLMKLTAGQNAKHAPEFTFKGLLAVLLSAAASESAFSSRFLGANLAILRSVFKPAFAAVEDHVRSQVAESYDAIGLILMIRVSRRMSEALPQANREALSPLFDSLNMILWPRFKALLDLHVASVKAATPPSLLAHSGEKYPHQITRRFAELSASLLQLRDASCAEMLDHSLTYMRGEVMALLHRMAGTLSEQRVQIIFRINQLDAILGVYAERGVLPLAAPFFQQKLDADVSALVEHELLSRYGGLVRLVVRVEEAAERSRNNTDSPAPTVALAEVRPLAEYFASSWRHEIKQINLAIMGNFHNMKNGMEILKRTLTQMLLYYTRFLDLVKKFCPEAASLASTMVHIPSIIAEIKQYSRTF